MQNGGVPPSHAACPVHGPALERLFAAARNGGLTTSTGRGWARSTTFHLALFSLCADPCLLSDAGTELHRRHWTYPLPTRRLPARSSLHSTPSPTSERSLPHCPRAMSTPGDPSSPKADSATIADPAATRSTLSRPTSRRSLKSSDAAHPLLAPSQDSTKTGSGGTGPYAVYSAGKRRAAGSSGASFASTSPSLVSPGEAPLSPSASATSSALSTPPFAPTSAPFLPPLVSRPSNSTLPSPSGRHYARSVSEAKEQLQRQALKAELQALGLATESAGAALVTQLASVGTEPELKGLQELVAGGKVRSSPASRQEHRSDDLAVSFRPLSSSRQRSSTRQRSLRRPSSSTTLSFSTRPRARRRTIVSPSSVALGA